MSKASSPFAEEQRQYAHNLVRSGNYLGASTSHYFGASTSRSLTTPPLPEQKDDLPDERYDTAAALNRYKTSIAYFLKGSYESSLIHIDYAINNIDKNNPDYHTLRSFTLAALGKFNHALSAINRSIALKPDSQFDDYRTLLKHTLDNTSFPLEAFWNHSHETDYEKANAHYAVALSFAAKKLHKEADRYFDQAARYPIQPAEFHIRRSITYLALGRNEDALASSNKALWQENFNPNAHYSKAVALHHLGRYAEATASFARVDIPSGHHAGFDRDKARNAAAYQQQNTPSNDRAIINKWQARIAAEAAAPGSKSK